MTGSPTYIRKAEEAAAFGKPLAGPAYSVDQRSNHLLLGILYALLAVAQAINEHSS